MKKLLPLTFALALSGCVHVNSSVMMDRSAHPVEEDDVEVFGVKDPVPETCERVAILQGSGSEEFSNESRMVKKFKAEAGKLGANAVHLQRSYGGSDERMISSIFGSERASTAMALWCPGRGGGEAEAAGGR